MSSCELKTLKFSLVLHTRENSNVSTHSMKSIWFSPQKSKYPLYVISMCMITECV